MKRAKRILAMVLAVVMIAGMAPTQAWNVHAEETTDQSTEISSADQDAAVQNDAAAEASENTAETYAVDPQAVTTAVYEQVDSIESGEEYLIVYQTGSYSNRQYYALTANGNSPVLRTDCKWQLSERVAG